MNFEQYNFNMDNYKSDSKGDKKSESKSSNRPDKTMKFTDMQLKAYNSIRNGKNVFLTGSAGTGKTSVIKSYVKEYNFKRKIAVTSTTGTSALLVGGTTLHSYLKIGLGKENLSRLYKKITSNKNWTKRWRDLSCLIIDEISMLDPVLFDKLESLAKMIRGNSKPFGGIQLILSGDFLQLPCVGTDKFCFEATSWSQCIHDTYIFTEIIRQSDSEFQNCLNFLRFGVVNEEVIRTLSPRIGAELNNEFDIKPTKLYARNFEVDELNDRELDRLAKDEREFYEYTMEIKQMNDIVSTDFINKIKKNCNAPENLQLCIGAQVMLLINLDLQIGLCNGSRGIVVDFINDIPIVKFLNGIELPISHFIWDIEDGDDICLRLTQIPLKIAYATTIHKSQGSSLDYVEIDLTDIFDYGQAYVALSRVKKLEGLSIIAIDYDKIFAHPVAVQFYKNTIQNETQL
jgi:ATP-dependent DNA helicase PIF1